MKITIKGLDGKSVDISKYMAKLSYETSLDEIFSTLKFDLPFYVYDENDFGVFSKVTAEANEFDFNGVIINTDINNLKRVTLEVVSDSFYLSTYEEIFKVKDYSAEKTIEKVMSYYNNNFKTETIPLQNKITKIYKGKSIIDVVDDVLKQSEGAYGKKIYRTFENDTLTIFDTPTPYPLKLEATISKLKLQYNGEDLKTRVKVYTEDKKKIAIQEIKDNDKMIERAGIIQKIHDIKVKDKDEAELVAQNVLNIYSKIKRTGSFTIFGDYKARVGMGVTIEGNDYIISALKHTITDEIHLMTVAVVLYEG